MGGTTLRLCSSCGVDFPPIVELNVTHIPKGVVYLVGAGPGDPSLLTLRGRAVLESCDAVVYDYLASESLLELAPDHAARVYVGKTGAHKGASTRQERIHEILIARALRGERVVRLKGGDPFVFGRGGEEAEVLRARGVRFEVVPGISSAIAAAAYAGIPLTHRDINTCAAFITGHEDPNRPEGRTDWSALAGVVSRGGTLVILMGVKKLRRNMDFLAQHAVPKDTPVAVVRWGTRADQETVVADLSTIADACEERGLRPPAVVVVGRVVEKREQIQWFERRVLHGCDILLTRSEEASSVFAGELRDLGGAVWVAPCVGFEAMHEEAVDDALRSLSSRSWVVFTSANTVRFVAAGLDRLNLDGRVFAQTRIACVGPKTASVLWDTLRLRPDLVPDRYTAEDLALALSKDVKRGDRIWLPQSNLAREVLGVELRKMGCDVDELSVYRTGRGGAWRSRIRERVLRGGFDAVLFASPSAVRHFCDHLEGQDLQRVLRGAHIVCIGPVTERAVREAGLSVGSVASPCTQDGMLRALVAHWAHLKEKKEP